MTTTETSRRKPTAPFRPRKFNVFGPTREITTTRPTGPIYGPEKVGPDGLPVLDGHGRNRSIGRTRVTYSGSETADTIIERLAHRSAEGCEVTVVSSDSVLRHVAERSGVHAMSAREFADRLSAAPRERFQPEKGPSRRLLGDALDPAVREALERMRRGS